MVEKKILSSKIILKKGDITKEDTDVIVNAANPGLMGGGGVDGAIHRAGGPAILEECKKIRERIGRLQTGKAVVTTGGRLKAKYVIHTVGPVWKGGEKDEASFLRSCYKESLSLAIEKGCKSVSFPSISTGAYGYPVELAAKEAIGAVSEFLRKMAPSIEVRFILFDDLTFNAYKEALEEESG